MGFLWFYYVFFFFFNGFAGFCWILDVFGWWGQQNQGKSAQNNGKIIVFPWFGWIFKVFRRWRPQIKENHPKPSKQTIPKP